MTTELPTKFSNMDAESNDGNNLEREITEAKWQALEKESVPYVVEIQANIRRASGSYRHIMGNAVNTLIVLPILDREDKTFDRYKLSVENLGLIKRYFGLMKEFPEFGKKESEEEGGYFPELFQTDGSVKGEVLVQKYEDALRSSY